MKTRGARKCELGPRFLRQNRAQRPSTTTVVVKGAAMSKQHPTSKPPDPGQLRLALRPKQAAKALGIGERLLWSKTNAGEIPHLRIGRAVVYPVDLLNAWLAEQAKAATR